jgi:hypothetical protein
VRVPVRSGNGGRPFNGIVSHQMKRLRKFGGLLSIACCCSLADSPLPPPATLRICNRDVTFCAELDPASDAAIYRIGPKFVAREEYRVPGWHRLSFLSGDGAFFASEAYLPMRYAAEVPTENSVVLRIWRNGQPHMSVTLGQVLRSLSSLQTSVSHFSWGRNLGFRYDGRFEMETVERTRVIVDPVAKTVKIDR